MKTTSLCSVWNVCNDISMQKIIRFWFPGVEQVGGSYLKLSLTGRILTLEAPWPLSFIINIPYSKVDSGPIQHQC
jgi:hypothetical protein